MKNIISIENLSYAKNDYAKKLLNSVIPFRV